METKKERSKSQDHQMLTLCSAISGCYSYTFWLCIFFKPSNAGYSREAVPCYISTNNEMSDPVSLHPCQLLRLSLFFILANLVGAEGWLIVISYVCLMI